jgi:putative transposase
VFHVLNRGVGRMRLFDGDGDCAAFERALADTLAARPVDLFAYCLMPNHWHLLVRPAADGDLAAFMQRLTITHVRRWVEYRHDVGNGHVYQGRYKSFPVEADAHFLVVARYVERNALRAGLVTMAQDWSWSSLWRREHAAGTDGTDGAAGTDGWSGPERPPLPLADWPVAQPADWLDWVNAPQTAAEVEAVRRCVRRGRPYGTDDWVARTAAALGLATTLRPRGRPRNPARPT